MSAAERDPQLELVDLASANYFYKQVITPSTNKLESRSPPTFHS